METSPQARLRAQILDDAAYVAERKQRRRHIITLKRHRRIAVGPHAVLHFENFATMLYQIQEMLWIEKGGQEQLEDELRAYAPLVPNGRELVATMMLEIDDKAAREDILPQLGNIDSHVFLELGGEKSVAQPEQDVERTTEAGRASSVHFLHFPLSQAQMDALRDSSGEIAVVIDHPRYAHRALLSEEQKRALASDLHE